MLVHPPRHGGDRRKIIYEDSTASEPQSLGLDHRDEPVVAEDDEIPVRGTLPLDHVSSDSLDGSSVDVTSHRTILRSTIYPTRPLLELLGCRDVSCGAVDGFLRGAGSLVLYEDVFSWVTASRYVGITSTNATNKTTRRRQTKLTPIQLWLTQGLPSHS